MRPSMQELLRRRRGHGFVGRRRELAAYRDNLDRAPEDAAHRFLFHVHGVAGIGKTSLVRRFQQTARELGAVTAYVDETADTVPDAMEAVADQLAAQGHPLKDFARLLAHYRKRRHEADAALPLPGTDAPSPITGIAAQAGLAGLGLVPGLGPIAGAMDPQQVAQGLDRWRTAVNTRLRSHDDVRLVLEPLRELTPVFLADLDAVARDVPWIALFFDTYERTAAVLETWLVDVMTGDRYGALPATVVVTTAGQRPLDAARWPAGSGFVEELRLELFTEDELRGLLAAKGVTDERSVAEIAGLSGRLPVLAAMLAGTAPEGPSGDLSGTAVERFLKWVTDPVQRSAALAGALPPWLDEDTFRAAADAEAADLYTWLRSLPFVSGESGRVRYHTVVRDAMLRVQRSQSPQRWREQHRRLAQAHTEWREEVERGLPESERWGDERWFRHRAHGMYHQVCADPRARLPHAVHDTLYALGGGLDRLRNWVRTVRQAGADTQSEAVVARADELLHALADDDLTALCTVLLQNSAYEPKDRALALAVRGRELQRAGGFRRALTDLDEALRLDPHLIRAYEDRGQVHWMLGEYEAALADLDHAVAEMGEAGRESGWPLAWRGRALQKLGRLDEALTDYTRAVELEPSWAWPYGQRAGVHLDADRHQRALADLDRAVQLEGGYAWAWAMRGETYRRLGRYAEAVADLDHALALREDFMWALACRGRCHAGLKRYGDAVVDYTRVLRLAPDDAWVLRLRATAYRALDRLDESLADFTRALEHAEPTPGRLSGRSLALTHLGRLADARADLDRALALDPRDDTLRIRSVWLDLLAGRTEEAGAALGRLLTRQPDDHARYRRAVCARRLGRHDDARGDLAWLLVDGQDPRAEFDQAVLDQRAHGPLDPRRWRELEALLVADCVTDADKAADRFVCRCAAAEGPGADEALAELLASRPYWLLLTSTLWYLDDLAAAPGADAARLATYRDRLLAARDRTTSHTVQGQEGI